MSSVLVNKKEDNTIESSFLKRRVYSNSVDELKSLKSDLLGFQLCVCSCTVGG